MPIKRNARSDCLSIYYLITGSIPPLLNGWHLIMRLNNRAIPLKGPCVFRESMPYCEHVGSNLQFEPKQGDMIKRYNFIGATSVVIKILFISICKKSSRKYFSTFFASSRKNAFSTNARHAFTKTVFIFSLSFAWLICSLHCYLRIKTMKLPIFILQTN